MTLPTTTLIHGDCLDVMPTLQLDCACMCFADLPYGALKHRAWDSPVHLDALWQCLDRILKPNAVTCLTANMAYSAQLVASKPKLFRYDIVWKKRYASNFLMAKKRVLSIHEHILIFAASRHLYVPQMRPEALRQKTWNQIKTPSSECKWHQGSVKNKVRVHGDMYPVSIIETFEPRTGKVHPTQKPVALLEWLIRTYTNPGDTVLDPTAGSGTTAVAALRTGRHSICIEKDKGYYDVMCKRVADERARLEALSVATTTA